MSGIVGIINLDGAPVDRDLLRRMTEFMSYRGPDAQEIWTEANVGFGHAMLRTTFEAETEKQPLTLDGKVWLVADARIDRRDELISKLEAKPGTTLRAGPEAKTANDAELILYAYQAWGEDCVKHLIGDFAFAIWDQSLRRLFCTRDHFGVRPFYYAVQNGHFIFSSSPNCLKIHPAISNNLDDNAIGDFLLFEMNLDPSRSAFADVRRLPPAHKLTLLDAGLNITRYWSLPIDEEIRYKKHDEYIDYFRGVMLKAVTDRLRTDRVSVPLSGGMDSGTVAASARKLINEGSQGDLQAFTYVYDYLMPDEERYYSGLAAQKLNIPINYIVSDPYDLYQWPAQPGFCPGEIINEPLRALFNDFIYKMSQHSRVALSGDGGDALFYPTDNYPAKIMGQWQGLLRNTAYSLWSYGRIPRMGFRSSIKRFIGLAKSKTAPVYPDWLDPLFEERFALRSRWEDQNKLRKPAHPRRNNTFESLNHPMWPHLFADHDPDTTRSPIEFRYPFFDIRVVHFLLNVPSLPWCFEKGLLRAASRGDLPENVRKRSKKVIVRDPILVRVEKPEWQLSDCFQPIERLFDYVNTQPITKTEWLRQKEEMWLHVRPLSLNYWLRSVSL
jgi:asparagine synthase (glutamine-hydrolysing)